MLSLLLPSAGCATGFGVPGFTSPPGGIAIHKPGSLPTAAQPEADDGAGRPIFQQFVTSPAGNWLPGQTVSITAHATDPADQALAYVWSADGGSLPNATGPTIQWTLPDQPGAYQITVTIVNSAGGVTKASQGVTIHSDMSLQPAAGVVITYPATGNAEGGGGVGGGGGLGGASGTTTAASVIQTLAGNGADLCLTACLTPDGAAAFGAALGEFSPQGLAVGSDGTVYFSDTYNHRVRTIDPAGNLQTVAGTGTAAYVAGAGVATAVPLSHPAGLGLASDGSLYIADRGNFAVRRLAAGQSTRIAGNGPTPFGGLTDSALPPPNDGGLATAANLYGPTGVAIAANGDVYVTDWGFHRIRKVEASTGTISTVAGNGLAGGAGDGGPAAGASLRYPTSLTLDGQGHLYVADSGNHRIRKIDLASGTISTVAGTGTPGDGGDGGQATSADLWDPQGVCIDGQGNLFIADAGNHRVRKVTAATGTITTVAGNGQPGFSGDGQAPTNAQLNFPTGVAVDGGGKLYIVDLGNRRLRVVAPI